MRVGVSLPQREMAGDLLAIRDFAQAAEELGLTHLRVTDQVIRPNSGALHEPLSLLSYLAGVTKTIELVTSILILPLRQTALVARQTAALDVLSEGRFRLGIGVGANPSEFQAMGVDFHTRGKRCDEQLSLLHQLWAEPSVTFRGRFDTVIDNGIDPRPVRGRIPIWVGGRSTPSAPVVKRIGKWASGWFVLVDPEQYPQIKAEIDAAALAAGRDPAQIGAEAGVPVVGERANGWQSRVLAWQQAGISHLCLRTLRGGLASAEHLPKLREVVAQLPLA